MRAISSPRLLHMLEVSGAMAHVTNPELQEIDCELILTFRRYLTVRNLQLRVFVIAEQLGDVVPKENREGSSSNGFTSTGYEEKL
jgi:hypothetical protein